MEMIAWLFEVSNRTLGVNPAFLKMESTLSRMVEIFCVEIDFAGRGWVPVSPGTVE